MLKFDLESFDNRAHPDMSQNLINSSLAHPSTKFHENLKIVS